ncbi:hypothetical protein [Agrobacterium tumefaciens]|uniref:hypothetical protein n=1 Tax=Agrobacterium tumefaciens TaxID=358 RepID=UPI001AE35E2D|nr:hypothetical protein [Agrobacterium tumefaciens]MBP2534734.1 hypothetical protein [Agrobacterium tumefaciens]
MGAISLNRFWNATVSFAVSVEIHAAARFSAVQGRPGTETRARQGEDVVSIGFYLLPAEYGGGGGQKITYLHLVKI